MKKVIILLKGNIDFDSRVQKEITTFISLGFRVTLAVWNWAPITYKVDKLEIIDINLSDHNVYHGGASTLVKIVKFWFICARIIRNGNYDIIHCNDLDTLGIMFLLPSHYHKCIIYDAHELYPEQYSIKSIRYRIWNYAERRLIKKVHTIIVPEINRGEFFQKKYSLKQIPFVINNFPKFQKVIAENIREELHLSPEAKLICYQGKIDRDRDIENIIDSLRYVPKNFVLIFFGYAYGDYINELKKYIKKIDVAQRVFFYGKVSPQEMLQKTAGCDICIALYPNNGINNYLCASNKVFDSIMAGIKIITNDYPPHYILKKYRFVSLISEVEPKKIAESVRNLIDDDTEISDDIKRKFSWDPFQDVFKQIYT